MPTIKSTPQLVALAALIGILYGFEQQTLLASCHFFDDALPWQQALVYCGVPVGSIGMINL